MSSFAEAAVTVAACLPPGQIVVGDEEYRDNLFPWVALRATDGEVVRVSSRDGGVRTEDLIAAMDPDTVLVAVSEVLSRDGVRADLPSLRAAADEVGARLFIDATQSLGVLRFDWPAIRPDYLAVHGYKWLLCPRGAGWLVAREDRVSELRPQSLPSIRSIDRRCDRIASRWDLVSSRFQANCSNAPAAVVATCTKVRSPAAVRRRVGWPD